MNTAKHIRRFSVALSTIAPIVWALSVFVCVSADFNFAERAFGAQLENGSVNLVTVPNPDFIITNRMIIRRSEFLPGLHGDLLKWSLGLNMPRYQHFQLTSTAAYQDLKLPIWLITLIAATPALIIRFINKRRARRLGLCSKCNYNLNQNQSGKCPECGTPTNCAIQPESRSLAKDSVCPD